MPYSTIENKTFEQLDAELKAVYVEYPEYSNTDYGSGKFEEMVTKFAGDNFYNLHYVAQEYLKQREALLNTVTEYKGWGIKVSYNPDYGSHPYEWHVTKDGETHNDPTSWQTYEGALQDGYGVVDYFESTPGLSI